MDLNQLRKNIAQANEAYRIGNPVMSDQEYDLMIDELKALSPDDSILNEIGHQIKDDTRKAKLPIVMASMTKVKSIIEINDWIRLKGISKEEKVIITPKYDGLSLCVDEMENKAWTRGDGIYGQKSDEHYRLIKNHLYDEWTDRHECPPIEFSYTYGEVMMPKKTFLDKYSGEFANPRNLVAGLLNSKEASSPLSDCNYIKYGGIFASGLEANLKSKSEVIDLLNKGQRVKAPYHLCKISDLTDELLISLFHQFSVDYEIDGLIIEIDDLTIQNKLGREPSTNNPVWARAYKHSAFEQTAETEVLSISWNISKQGYLKPTLHIKPVRLDGVTISNITGNNARFVKDLGLGAGAIITVKRSGMVIPIVNSVLKPVDFQMPNVPNITWNENGVELVTLEETEDQRYKKIVAFFEILEAKNISEGVIKQLFDAGFKTIKDVISLTPDVMCSIPGFGKRKSQIVFKSIQESIKDVSLSKLQHASGIFKGLGSKKLALLEHFTQKPSIDDVSSIEGFADISAKSYVDNYDLFFEWVKDLNISFKINSSLVSVNGDLVGKTFVFTGVRLPEMESLIESRGGKIGSGVSKKTTYLVMKSKGSGSSKELKAIELGVQILTVEELENLLK